MVTDIHWDEVAFSVAKPLLKPAIFLKLKLKKQFRQLK